MNYNLEIGQDALMSFTVETTLSKEIAGEFDDVEIATLGKLLQLISQLNRSLSYKPINDIEDKLGLEIFLESEKVAEVYCAETQYRKIANHVLLHYNKDWNQALILDLLEASKIIAGIKSCRS